ncbi:pectate lyase [Flavobacterium hiemivividum]|uniref:Pectinesterase n=1 Tax=Flavobacterium hiemivividum TaxID=2541734 RepID=A0A4R5CXW9_9FLAO|nr:pectate lyase [Flavobacterium hiemivividum]TDE02693.1 pectate lyase [Flavobacterium hiemivividum]
MKVLKIVVTTVLLLLITNTIQAQKWANFVREHDEAWFATPEAKEIAENVLLYQRNIGGWPKNIQMQNALTDAQKKELIALKSDTHNITTDNGATTQEMLYLSKMYAQYPEEKYKKAFLLGLDYILEAQYDNGGWPQFYPLKKGYYTHITYNDDSMVHIMEALEAILDKTDYYSIKPDEKTIEKTRVAFNKGIVCILKTQYSQNGVLTAWCAQHDKETLLPAKARAYELPSLSGKESAKIVLLLMSIQNPSPEVITAINSAVAWFEKTKITGIKIEEMTLQNGKKDRVLVTDPDAKPLWARFMELDDNTPFFCDRDGLKKATISEISYERRNGYGWYTDQPKEVLKEYPRWKKKIEAIQLIKKQVVLKEEFNIVVDQSGNGDFKTIQQAINASKAYPSERITIFVKNGIYNEKVKVPEWNSRISLIGESREKTIITYDDHFNKIGLGRNSTFYTYTVLIEGNDFFCKNLTIQNTSGQVGQAVALNVNANRVMFTNCSFLGYQDTLYTSGEGTKNYFKDCYIEGTTDFIFGDATVLFENCVINNKSDSYITAASTPKDSIYGYVFKNCKLIADANATKVYLGRPWRPYAKTVFMNCEMGKHILPEGWHNWSKPDAETSSFYAEYKCTGEGYQPKNRVAWSHQLKNSEAKKYTIENILDSDTTVSNKQWYLRNN